MRYRELTPGEKRLRKFSSSTIILAMREKRDAELEEIYQFALWIELDKVRKEAEAHLKESDDFYAQKLWRRYDDSRRKYEKCKAREEAMRRELWDKGDHEEGLRRI